MRRIQVKQKCLDSGCAIGVLYGRVKIIRTKPYIKAAKRIGITAENEAKLFDELRDSPEKGDLIVGSGGVRKVRMALGNRGKSAGARVIYAYFAVRENLYLFTAYTKSERANLTGAEINQLRDLVDLIKKEIGQ